MRHTRCVRIVTPTSKNPQTDRNKQKQRETYKNGRKWAETDRNSFKVEKKFLSQ